MHSKEIGTSLKGNKSKYLQLFSKVKNEKAIGEASPTYLRDPESAIKDQQPDYAVNEGRSIKAEYYQL